MNDKSTNWIRLTSPYSGKELHVVFHKALGNEISPRLESSDSLESYDIINGVAIIADPNNSDRTLTRKRIQRSSRGPSVSGAINTSRLVADLSVTQSTFSEEWAETNNSLSFIYNSDDLVRLHRDVWIQMGEEERSSVRTVLNVGCGNGAESIALSTIFPNAAIAAVDLNLNLLSSNSLIRDHPRITPVLAPLQRMPFDKRSFDHVHCQGVLHHNRSTHDSLREIAEYVKPGGSLFVWVYAHEDRHAVSGNRGRFIRLYWRISHFSRFFLSRAPAPLRALLIGAISAAIHPIVKRRALHTETWTLRNTKHGIRDAFTPRFAHEHSVNEVARWLGDLGFENLRFQNSSRYTNLFNRRLTGIGFRATRSTDLGERTQR